MSNSVARKLFAVGLAASTALMGLAPLAAKAAPHAAGTNVNYQGTIWMVMPDGTRRAYTSAGAFLSYGFNSFANVVEANSDDLALPAGAFIPPQDGKVICSDRGADKGTCYVISGAMKYGFTSAAVFTGLGFSFARAQSGDVSFLSSGATNVDNTTAAHVPGVLVNNGGTVQLRGTSGNLGIPDIATFNTWGYSFADVVPANDADKAMTQSGVMAARTPGMLSPIATTGGTVTPGSVTVSAAPGMNPASTVPSGATNVSFVKFTISNGNSSAVTVNGITVNRSGAGKNTDFSNVYIFQGGTRLSTGRTINSSTNQANFNGLNLSVPGNGSVTLEVTGDIAAQPTSGVGNVNILTVSGVTLGDGSTASGSVSSNAMTIATAAAGTVTITGTGSGLSNPKVGDTGVILARFRIDAGSQEDLTLKRITLYNGGNINANGLTNLKLTQAGTQVGSTVTINAKGYIAFDGLSFDMQKGNSKTFEVWGDISGSARPNDTIKLYVEENTDLNAMGKTYGFGAAVTNSFGSGAATSLTIQGGLFTVTFNGPAAKDVGANSQDVEIFNFTVISQNNVEIRGLKINATTTGGNMGSGSVPYFKDVKVWDASNNSVVWGPQDFTSAAVATGSLTFTEFVNQNAGSSKSYKVTADVDTNATPNEVLVVTLDMPYWNTVGSSRIKNTDNNQFLNQTTSSDIVPNAALTGNNMTVKSTSLSITKAGTPTSQSFVKGANAVPMVGINLQAGTAKDVKITGITLTSVIAGAASSTGVTTGTTAGSNIKVSDAVTTVELYDGTTKVGDTKSPNGSDGKVQFTNLNYIVPKGTTKTLVVKANSNSSVAAGTQLKFGIAANTDVTSNDVLDGNSIVATLGSPVNVNTTMAAAGESNIIFTGQGSVSLTLVTPSATDGDDSRIVVAGQSNVTMGRFRLSAANEDLQLTKARIKVAATSTNSIVSVTLWDGASQIAGPVTPDGSGNADFNSITPAFVVSKGSDKTVTVKVTLNTTQAGATSGAVLQSIFDGNNNFEMRGTGSSNTLITVGTTSPTSSKVVLHKTKPTVTLVSLPSTALAVGTQVIQKFTITADAGSRVALKKISFNVALTNATLTADSLAIRESGAASDITLITTTSTVAATGGTGFVNFSGEQTIEGGSSKTFELKANVASVIGSGSASVQTKLLGDTAVIDNSTLSGAGIGVGGTDYSFVWSDSSADGHDTTTGDWNNGTYVKPLPTDPQSLSKS